MTIIAGNIYRRIVNIMADMYFWIFFERVRSSFIPVLVFIITLYLPKMHFSYAQNLPNIDIEMEAINADCVEGQTVILYCAVNGVSSVAEYEVNWTKGVRLDGPSTGVALVPLETERVTTSKWETDSDSVTHTFRMDNATTNDNGVYRCQIFYSYNSNINGKSSWSDISASMDVRIRHAMGPLPKCINPRTDNTFYTEEIIQFSCIPRIDDDTLWERRNIDGKPLLMSDQNTDIHSIELIAQDELNGALFICTQFRIATDTGNQEHMGDCIIGPIRVLPAPSKLPTTPRATPVASMTTSLATTSAPPRTLEKVPDKVVEIYKPNGMGKVNQTLPSMERDTLETCPAFVYILVPTIIAAVSIVLNLYLLMKVRQLRKGTVDKICDNKHCDTIYRNGNVHKDEYCTCGYMLKIAQQESAV